MMAGGKPLPEVDAPVGRCIPGGLLSNKHHRNSSAATRRRKADTESPGGYSRDMAAAIWAVATATARLFSVSGAEEATGGYHHSARGRVPHRSQKKKGRQRG